MERQSVLSMLLYVELPETKDLSSILERIKNFSVSAYEIKMRK